MDVLIVLAHGIFGWGEDHLPRDGFTRAYFYGVGPFLQKYGLEEKGVKVTVVAPSVTPCDAVEVRGKTLARAIRAALQTVPAGTKAHIIAHSMGGLDARWAIASEGLADQVASLTTLGTPHRGTTLGNLCLLLLPVLEPVTKAFFARVKAFCLRSRSCEFLAHILYNVAHSESDELRRGVGVLTTKGADSLTEQLKKSEGEIVARPDRKIVYAAYGGKSSLLDAPILALPWLILTASVIVGTSEGRTGHDGCVSVSSAHYPWDESAGGWNAVTPWYRKTVPFSHITMMNMRIPERRAGDGLLEHLKPMYRDILDRIIELERRTS